MKDLQTAMRGLQNNKAKKYRSHARSQSETGLWKKEMTKPATGGFMHRRSQSFVMTNPLETREVIDTLRSSKSYRDASQQEGITSAEKKNSMPSTSTSTRGNVFQINPQSIDEMTVSTETTRYLSWKGECSRLPTMKELSTFGASLTKGLGTVGCPTDDVQEVADDTSSSAARHLAWKGKHVFQRMPNQGEIAEFALSLKERIPDKKNISSYAATVSDHLPDRNELTAFATSIQGVLPEGLPWMIDKMEADSDTIRVKESQEEVDNEILSDNSIDCEDRVEKQCLSCVTNSIAIDVDASDSIESQTDDFIIMAIGKENRSVKENPGISFARSNPNAPLTIEYIDPNGLFGKTDLKPGMVLMSINGRNMMWKCPRVAADFVAISETVTIRAEAFIGKAHKKESADKVGMTLKRSKCGNNIYISEILSGGKFAASNLKVGMVVLEINDQPCPKTIKETKSLTRSINGELKIMAVNLDRQWATYNRRREEPSKESMETSCSLAYGNEAETEGLVFDNGFA